MKRNIYAIIIFTATLLAATSCTNDAWDNMPQSLTEFFSTYFPGQEVSSYTEIPSGSVASIKGGATVTFNSSGSWMIVNGNGSTIPSIFLYDRLPPKLYNYLLETEATEGVYKVSRDSTVYTVELHDSVITYTIADQTIRVK